MNKNELIQRIELLSDNAQRCLTNLLLHNMSSMPIEYKETSEYIELASCGLIKQAATRDDFFELSTNELEMFIHYIGEKIESELTKNELIELIMQHDKKISESFVPILTFSNKRAIAAYLFKKFDMVFV